MRAAAGWRRTENSWKTQCETIDARVWNSVGYEMRRIATRFASFRIEIRLESRPCGCVTTHVYLT